MDRATNSYRYDAFISYRGVEPDREVATWLHSALESYSVPTKLVQEKQLPKRLKRVFLDGAELKAGDLPAQIKAALEQSRYLIVVCSPRTPKSEWIDKEVTFFREFSNDDDYILPLLIEGKEDVSYPKTLDPKKVLGADTRPVPSLSRRQIRHLAKLRLLAALLGCGFDELRERHQERQKARLLCVGACLFVLALVMICLSVWAWNSGVEADRQRQLAKTSVTIGQGQSQLALESLERIIFDVQSDLRNLPGSGPVRERMLQDALAQLKQVSDYFVTHTAIDRNTMAANVALGDVYLQFGSKSSAEREETALSAADKCYRQALCIAERLVKEKPRNTQSWRDLSIAHEKMGDIAIRKGQIDEALAAYQNSLNVRHSLWMALQNDEQTQRDLFNAYTFLGNVQLQTSRVTEAFDSFTKGLSLAEQLAKNGSRQSQRDLAEAYDNMCGVHLRLNQLPEAEKACQDCMKIRQQLMAHDDTESQLKRELSQSHQRLGEILLRTNKVSDAIAHFRLSLEILQKLAEDQNNNTAQRDLAMAHNAFGDVLLLTGQVNEAIESYKEMLKIAQERLKREPSDAVAQLDLSVSYEKLVDALLQSNKLEEARQACDEAIKITENVTGNQRNPVAQRALFTTYQWRGNVQLQSGQPDKALISYEKSLGHAIQLQAADPDDAIAKRDLYVAYQKLGDANLRLEQFEKALKYFEMGHQFCKELDKGNRQDALVLRDLYASHVALGNVCLQTKKYDEALSHHCSALKILESAAGGDAQALAFDKCVIHNNIGHILYRMKQYRKAKDSFRGAHELLLSLEEGGKLAAAQKNMIRDIEYHVGQCERASIATSDWKSLLQQPTELLNSLLELRATLFVEDGKIREAILAVTKLREVDNVTANQLYNAACVYVLCAGNNNSELTEQYVSDALVTLGEAVTAGFNDFAHMQVDPDLAPLRNSPKLRELQMNTASYMRWCGTKIQELTADFQASKVN